MEALIQSLVTRLDSFMKNKSTSQPDPIYLQRLHVDQLTGDDMQGRREWERSGHGLPA
ncbi:hypothetical protein [Haloferula sargassicola]|uniref:hypothetical protein n=1 Tax=Haloferula sargassicola TaxID=490096 RepID=UPI00336571DF